MNIINPNDIQIVNYDSNYFSHWEIFCDTNIELSFQYKKSFYEYHQKNYMDESLLLFLKNKVIGIMPLARIDNKVLHSHPGAAFGGLILDKKIKGTNHEITLKRILEHILKEKNCEKIIYKYYPGFYREKIGEDEFWSLYKNGFNISDCKLTSIIDLRETIEFDKSRFKSLNNRKSIKIVSDLQYLSEFWLLLTKNLLNKYNSSPLHNFDEISYLVQRFPSEIEFKFALAENEIIAGLIFFNTKQVAHLQYSASSENGIKIGAVDILLRDAIKTYKERDKKIFDFGHSFDPQKGLINETLMSYKMKFGTRNMPIFQFTRIFD